MDIARVNNWWTSAGTSSDKIDSIVSASFEHFGSSKRGNNDHLNIYNNLKSRVDSGYTVLFSCVDHTMHAVGYIRYTVTYTTKVLWINTTTTKYEDFVIVNDGWENATTNESYKQYSYYPASLINAFDFVLTKILN
ncbi:MAG: hypothetical protein LBU04_03930 [Christensenellaceae bacterium]|jgi:hypothetical protein|nr:hypothetical protein [Christensenellaceae bacterium]